MYNSVFLFFTVFLLSRTLAVFSDEAYSVDFYHALLGLPIQQCTFFHQPNPASKASLIYTLTDKSILGAVNPKDGSIVWRQQLSDCESHKCFLRAGKGQDVVISANADEVSAWNAADGKLVWRTVAQGYVIEDLEIWEFPGAGNELSAKDALVLYNGFQPTLRRLSGESGESLWTYKDESEDSVHQVSMSNTAIYLVSVHHTILGGTKIKITQLDPKDGSKVNQYSIGAETELASKDSIHFVGVSGTSLLLAWMDKSSKNLKVHIIGSRYTSSFSVPSSSEVDDIAISLHTPDEASSLPHFLIGYDDGNQHWADVYHVDLQKKTITKAFDIPKIPGKGTFSTSTIDGNVYFARFTATDVSIISSASYKELERWITNHSTASSSIDQWSPSHAVSEIVSRTGSSLAIRSAVLSSNGEWVLIRNGATEWVRPEALAHARIAVWADYPMQEALAEQVAIESHQSYVHAYLHRFRRHLKNLQDVPQWAMRLYSGIISIITGSSQRARDLEKSLFGFHRLVIIATRNGQVVALNTGSGGRIVWKADMTKFNGPSDWSDISMRTLPGGFVELQVDGSMHYLSATSGEYIQLAYEIKQPGADPSMVQSKPLVSYSSTIKQVIGELRDQDAGPLWTFNVPAGELILSVQSRPLEDPVASIGRMLGDRRVLYKYLNANMAFIMTSHDSLGILSVYLIDSVSGNILYTSRHKNVDTSRPITSTLSENWIAYSFTANQPSSDLKGPLLVVADLYESSLPNDRGPLGTAPNFSAFEVFAALGDAAKPYVISQTYLVPEEISKMSVTHTRQGVSTRQLLLALPQSNSVVGIPRSVIDPRRPIGRDPTKTEMAEGLSKYSPYLNFEPRWYLSHRRDVIGVQKIEAVPSGLESTSIVIAFGLDIFGTRVSPSHSFDKLGKDFNKIQMLGTVLALFVALVVIGPIVNRKKINTRWRNS